MQPQLSLIVPFYNEEARIITTYKRLTKHLQQLHKTYELLFVDDGSTDTSVNTLNRAIAKDKHATIFRYRQNKGRGYAVRIGCNCAKGKIIGYIDADLEIDPKYIKDCLAQFPENDVVVISKHHPNSQVTTSKLRYSASRLFNWWPRFLLKSQIHDHQAGLKFFKRAVLVSVLPQLTQNGWLFDLELLYALQLSKSKIVEVPLIVTYGFGPLRRSLISGFCKAIIFVMILRLNRARYI